jgi:phosphoglycolate phosphatase
MNAPYAITPFPSAKQVQLILTDMDSTLGLFWAYFCPAMKIISPLLAERLKVDQSEFEREVGRIMHLHGTHEWPWVLEETKFRRNWIGSPSEFRKQISEPFWTTLDEMRLRYLKPFPTVLETLAELKARGKTIIIVSDAPIYMALTRAADMGLDQYIDGLLALEAPIPHKSKFVSPEDMALGLERMRRFSQREHNFKVVETLPKHCEKPNPGGLQRAMKIVGVGADDCIYIGDSLKKDGGVAEAMAMRYFWAHYGIYLPGEYVEIIDERFTPTGEAPTNGHGVTYQPEIYPPMVAELGSFKQILHHLVLSPRSEAKTVLGATDKPSAVKSSGH